VLVGACGTSNSNGDNKVVAADCSDLIPAPEPGLAAYYRFDETDGLVCDWSGQGHHGTPQGTGYTRGVAGAVGKAISFSGGDGAVVVPTSTDFDFSTGATIEMFLRVDTTSASAVGELIGRGTGNRDDNVLMNTGCGNVQAVFTQETGVTTVTSRCSLVPVGSFVHVAVVNDGASLTMYFGGMPVMSMTGGQMGPLSTDVYIGRREQGIFPLVGALDEIKWWTVARAQADVCKDAGKRWSGTACM